MQAGFATDKWKRTIDDYVASAGGLCRSMALSGFLPEFAIPIDPAGELLDGSHRVACALALGIENVPVERKPNRAWAPDWSLDWFAAHGMGQGDFERLQQDWQELCGATICR